MRLPQIRIVHIIPSNEFELELSLNISNPSDSSRMKLDLVSVKTNSPNFQVNLFLEISLNVLLIESLLGFLPYRSDRVDGIL